MRSWFKSASAVQDRFQSLRGDPLSWIEWGVEGRRILLALLLFLLLVIQNVLGNPSSPRFNIAVITYIVYILFLEWLSRGSRRYHSTFWRTMRLQSHLITSTLILGFSGTTTVSYIVYLPWIITAAIYLKPSVAILLAAEAVILGSLAFWNFGLVPTERFWSESALLAVGLTGASLFTAYLWQELVSEWRSRVRQINALQKVGSAIMTASNVRDALERIFDLTFTLIPFETALILGWDPKTELLSPIDYRGYDPNFLKENDFIFRLDEGYTGHVAFTRKPLLVTDVERNASISPKHLEISEGKLLRSFVAVPLVFGDELLGVFELTSDQPAAFTRRSLEVLDWLSDQIAIAMRNVQLQQQLTGEAQEVERQYEELRDLYDISVALALQGHDVQALLQTIVVGAARLLDARKAALFLDYPPQRKVRMAISHNFDALRDWEFEYGKSMFSRVVESGEGLIVNDYPAWEGKDRRLDERPYRDLLKAVVNVPLKWEGQVIGVLTVADDRPNKTFSSRDRSRLGLFASQAAFAIEGARLASYRQKLTGVSHDAIIRVDSQGHIQEFNQASERILGYKSEEVLNDHVTKYYCDGETEARNIHRMLVSKGEDGVRDYRTCVRGRTEERIPILFSGMLLKDEAGQETGSFGIMTDLREKDALLQKQRKSDFLIALERHFPQDEPILDLSDLRRRLTCQMKIARDFCKSQYMILFASTNEGDTVLPVVAWTDLPQEIENDLPHYNWKKAGMWPRDGTQVDILGYEAALIAEWDLDKERQRGMIAGIRGGKSDFFSDSACIVPFRLADNFRSALVFGPFADQDPREHDAEFIKSVNDTIGIGALGWLQTLFLRSQQKEAELAAALVIHRAKVTLLQIDGKLGMIKRSSGADSFIYQMAEEGEQLVSDLSGSVSETLRSNVVEMEADDYDFQLFSLAVLVQNCAQGLMRAAKNRDIDLRIDSSVEYLPYVEIDPVFLSIALGNLLENALKYCFDNTYVRVGAEHDTQTVRITIDDLGYQLPEDARANLHEPGLRWKADGRKIPGMGLGLWEASRIAENHGGKLDFFSIRMPEYGRDAYHVRVWLEIPIRQK